MKSTPVVQDFIEPFGQVFRQRNANPGEVVIPGHDNIGDENIIADRFLMF
jgi:hypothetical protein